MKKAVIVLGCILTALLLFPFVVIIFSLFGYTIEITNYPVFISVIVAASIAETVLSIMLKEPIKNTFVGIWFSLLMLLAVICTYYFALNCIVKWYFAGFLIVLGCCCYLVVRHAKPKALMITMLSISCTLTSIMVCFTYFAIIFASAKSINVVSSIETSDGVYRADVIDDDQGALGGASYVYIYDNRSVDIAIFRIRKTAEEIYYGDWGEYEHIKIYWKNDRCLVIDGVEHQME